MMTEYKTTPKGAINLDSNELLPYSIPVDELLQFIKDVVASETGNLKVSDVTVNFDASVVTFDYKIGDWSCNVFAVAETDYQSGINLLADAETLRMKVKNNIIHTFTDYRDWVSRGSKYAPENYSAFKPLDFSYKPSKFMSDYQKSFEPHDKDKK